MDPSASATDLNPPPVDAGGGGANLIELDVAPPLSSAPAAFSATLAPLPGAQPSQGRPGLGLDVNAADISAHWYELEPVARKREGAREKSTSPVWAVVARLTPRYFDDNVLVMGGKGVETHVCRAHLLDAKGEPGAFCNARLVLSRQKIEGKKELGPYITTKAGQHCALKHHSTEVAVTMAAKAKTLAFRRQDVMLAGGQAGASSSKPLVQVKLGGMVLDSRQKALCAQVRFFVYSRCPISKSMFGDPAFVAMLRCNDKPGEPTPVLSFKMIDKWVEAECEIFLRFLRYAMDLKHEQAKGNAFAQAQHDGGTLKNHKKVQVQAVQWMDPHLNRNNVVVFALSSLAAIRAPEDCSPRTIDQEDDVEGLALDILPPMLIPAHTDANVAKDYTMNLEKATGLKFTDVIATSIQDGAACGVADHLALCMQEREVCNMHAASKIGAAALGFLTRSRMKKVIDPFPAGKKLCARILNVAKQFSHTKPREALARIAATLPDSPKLTLKVPLNGTRIAANHGLFISVLRMHKALRMYFISLDATGRGIMLEDEEIADALVGESILYIVSKTTTLAQYEHLFNGAIMVAIKAMTFAELRADHLPCIDLNSTVMGAHPQRIMVPVSTMSACAQEAVTRARLAAERRFSGNETLELTGKPLILNLRELLATILDVRTKDGRHLSQAQRREAFDLCLNELCKFTERCEDFDAAKAAKAAAAAAARVGAVRPRPPSLEAEAASRSPRRRSGGIGASDFLTSGAGSAAADEPDGPDPWDWLHEEAVAALPSTACDSAEAAAAALVARRAGIRALARPQLVRWLKLDVDYRAEFPDAGLPPTHDETGEPIPLEIVKDLMRLPIGVFYNKITAAVGSFANYGYIPLMASCSAGQIGALGAESFCERVLSAANLVLDEGNTCLKSTTIEMLVLLRINRDFIEYMRATYPHLSQQPFNMTTVPDSSAADEADGQ